MAVLCAYLRMPAPQDDAREAEVRRTAQRVLTRHLRADDDAFWPGVRLDLTGARLDGFDAAGCTLEDADLTGAVCAGTTRLAGATVRGRLRLGATFADLICDDLRGDAEIVLDDAEITGRVSFERADLAGEMSCRRATIGRASFRGTTLHRTASFDATRFTGGVSFREAVFLSGLSMDHAVFAGYTGFRQTHFADMALFRWTEFGDQTWFERTRFEGAANFFRARFHGPGTFDGASFARSFPVDQAGATAAGPHVWPEGTAVTRQDDDWLLLTD
ncbi:pentapeptide repeat-containing protein [Micromonospora echinofusca]|uniref:pentapeptide repeat-containing protein n=1 Tax=Micromonospora echinofusca TaxID=47858 RepID=UPI0033E1FB12